MMERRFTARREADTNETEMLQRDGWTDGGRDGWMEGGKRLGRKIMWKSFEISFLEQIPECQETLHAKHRSCRLPSLAS